MGGKTQSHSIFPPKSKWQGKPFTRQSSSPAAFAKNKSRLHVTCSYGVCVCCLFPLDFCWLQDWECKGQAQNPKPYAQNLPPKPKVIISVLLLLALQAVPPNKNIWELPRTSVLLNALYHSEHMYPQGRSSSFESPPCPCKVQGPVLEESPKVFSTLTHEANSILKASRRLQV